VHRCRLFDVVSVLLDVEVLTTVNAVTTNNSTHVGATVFSLAPITQFVKASTVSEEKSDGSDCNEIVCDVADIKLQTRDSLSRSVVHTILIWNRPQSATSLANRNLCGDFVTTAYNTARDKICLLADDHATKIEARP